MKEKSDYLKNNGYEFDSETENFINLSLKNVFTLDFLYDNTIGNIKKTHEGSDSTHVQFFSDGAPDRHMAEELLKKYDL